MKENEAAVGSQDSSECAVPVCQSDAPANDDQAKIEQLVDALVDDKLEAASSHNIDLGKRGEEAAARYLQRRGYEVLERNWTCPAGEADIVARDEDGTVVFAEVKTRSNVEHGFPEEAVNKRKREKYERIAGYYLRQVDFVDVPVRFDVIGLMVISEDRAIIRHHINAFGVD